eukprot:scaffold147442_cov19-Tisochrysis_lutea.AAC.2
MSTLALKQRHQQQEQDGFRAAHQKPGDRFTSNIPLGSRQSSSSSSSRSSSVDLESSSDEEAASFDPVCAAAHIPEQRGHAQEEAMSLALTIGTWTPGDGCPSLCESARAASGGPPDASSMKLPICGRMEANSRRWIGMECMETIHFQHCCCTRGQHAYAAILQYS